LRRQLVLLRRCRHNLMAFAGGSLLVLVCRTGIAADDSALLNALLREGVLSQGQVDRVRADLDNQAATTDQGLLGKIKTPGAWVEEIDIYMETCVCETIISSSNSSCLRRPRRWFTSTIPIFNRTGSVFGYD
jgi:hypothetical protein